MKKNIYIVIGLAVILGTVWSLSGSNKDNVPANAASVEVTVLEKKVFTGESKEGVTEIEGEKAMVEIGSHLKTGDKGRALIELGKAETVVDYNSEVIVTDATDKGSVLNLFIGSTWSRVEKLFDGGEYHEIKTKNTVASVRGTSFGVYYSGDTTRLVVATGTVAFISLDENGNKIASSTVYVSGGQEASRTGFGDIVRRSYSEDVKKEEKPTTVTSPVTTGSNTNAIANTNTSIDTDYIFKIYSVSSESMKKGVETKVVIRGEGFLRITSVKLNDDKVGYEVIDDERLTLMLPADIDEGVYGVELRGEGGRTALAEKAITVVWGRLQ